ncbi:hypothetical protein QGN23_11085 [Chryseobacterium gotjawalense]|uniref:Uncharacterized protein n=1 Tax=Chryseobacterium gotjawalense TaxID=3042315 RepID=A0ABY8RAW9_9FLAO|nr:hypothetical protein [Chryseobacterium sp. wdc7]WHF50971.1 hypothetical protein QGN23_11085 [Chryseobacterium sp. wdc7]
MKKLLAALSLVVGLGLANAQQVTPKSTAKMAPAKSEKMETAKKEAVEKSATAEKPAAKTYAVKMKKNGTPDKRYKANAHLKKNGTPDKRYKTK